MKELFLRDVGAYTRWIELPGGRPAFQPEEAFVRDDFAHMPPDVCLPQPDGFAAALAEGLAVRGAQPYPPYRSSATQEARHGRW